MTVPAPVPRHTGELIVGGLIGRLPISMVGVALLVLTSTPTGTGAAVGGALAAVFGLASAATSSMWGAIADRTSRRVVLLVTSVGHVVLLVATHLCATAGGGSWWMVAAVGACGALQPPITGALRAHWAELPPAAGTRARGLEVALTELVFVAGPLAVTLSITSRVLPPLITAAVFAAAGCLLLTRTSAIDRSRQRRDPSASRAGVSADIDDSYAAATITPRSWSRIATGVLAAVSAARVAAVAAVEVALIARAGGGAAASLAVACLAAGSVLGGLTLGRRPPTRSHVLLLATAGAALVAVSGVPAHGAWLYPLAAITCLTSAPLAIAVTALTDTHTRPDARARAHSLISGSAQYLGAATGFAAAGLLVDHTGPVLALGLPFLLLLTAAALTRAFLPATPATEPSGPTPAPRSDLP